MEVAPGVVKHVLLGKFKDDVSPEKIEELIRDWANLVNQFRNLELVDSHWEQVAHGGMEEGREEWGQSLSKGISLMGLGSGLTKALKFKGSNSPRSGFKSCREPNVIASVSSSKKSSLSVISLASTKWIYSVSSSGDLFFLMRFSTKISLTELRSGEAKVKRDLSRQRDSKEEGWNCLDNKEECRNLLNSTWIITGQQPGAILDSNVAVPEQFRNLELVDSRWEQVAHGGMEEGREEWGRKFTLWNFFSLMLLRFHWRKTIHTKHEINTKKRKPRFFVNGKVANSGGGGRRVMINNWRGQMCSSIDNVNRYKILSRQLGMDKRLGKSGWPAGGSRPAGSRREEGWRNRAVGDWVFRQGRELGAAVRRLGAGMEGRFHRRKTIHTKHEINTTKRKPRFFVNGKVADSGGGGRLVTINHWRGQMCSLIDNVNRYKILSRQLGMDKRLGKSGWPAGGSRPAGSRREDGWRNRAVGDWVFRQGRELGAAVWRLGAEMEGRWWLWGGELGGRQGKMECCVPKRLSVVFPSALQSLLGETTERRATQRSRFSAVVLCSAAALLAGLCSDAYPWEEYHERDRSRRKKFLPGREMAIERDIQIKNKIRVERTRESREIS
ncbi:hypothetical protein M5K25_027561 [Dendrobium thyrsiflorum]|uniref:Uncharacterized protein n=1 Tax=Dendrobium thyrsiflorum TaxID=117978 RepID=A0ABD0TU54_DENTH